jgi:hypothetical protein
MFMDDDDLFEVDDLEDDDEFEYEDDDDLDLDDEDLLVPGNTIWGAAWIFATAIADLAEVNQRFWHNVRTDLAYRHNKNMDKSEFIGSVEAGIENL